MARRRLCDLLLTNLPTIVNEPCDAHATVTLERGMWRRYFQRF
jgi:hypothetical protein